MDDKQLLRYSRHILLPQIDVRGQEKLLASRVLIIGLGGLGSPAAMYLAASGVGHLVLVDSDRVDLTNLQRQIVHATERVGQDKTASAARGLEALNPGVRVTTINKKIEGTALEEQVNLADVVVDATDNFASRFAINTACARAGKPLIFGAVVRFEGQVAVFPPGGPCYRCLYAEGGGPDEACATLGVLAPAAGVIGSIQAVETHQGAARHRTDAGRPAVAVRRAQYGMARNEIAQGPGLPGVRHAMNPTRLPRTIVNQLLHLAQKSPDEEICGLISRDRPRLPELLPRFTNTRPSDRKRFFVLDPKAQIEAMRAMRERGEELGAILSLASRLPARCPRWRTSSSTNTPAKALP